MFAFVFPLLCLSFYLFTCFLSFYPSLVWLPFVVLLHCLSFPALCLWLLFLFPFRMNTQKERAQRFCPLRPLFVCCACLDSCIVVEKLPRCVFGFFQFVRFVLPCNAARIRRLARSNFDFLRHYVDIAYNSSAFLK